MSNIKEFPPVVMQNNDIVPTTLELDGGDGEELIINFPIGTLLGDIQDYIYRNSMYPCRNAAGIAAITAAGAMMDASYLTPTGLKLCLYSLTVMPTGTGKDAIKDNCNRVVDTLGRSRILGNMGVSKQAMHTVLQNKEVLVTAIAHNVLKRPQIKELIDSVDPKKSEEGWEKVKEAGEALMLKGEGVAASTFVVADEFHQHFSGIDKANSSPYQRELRDFLMAAFTERYMLRPTEAMTQKYLALTAPNLNILGFSTPAEMFSVLGSQIENGLVGRLIIYANNTRPLKNYNYVRGIDIPNLDSIQFWAEKVSTLSTDGHRIDWDKGAMEHYIALDTQEIEPLKIGPEAALANRLGEKMLKIATTIALTEAGIDAVVKTEHIDTAWGIVSKLHHQFIEVVTRQGGLGASVFNQAVVATELAIHKWAISWGKDMPHTKLKENCKLFRECDHRTQSDVIKQLEVSGLVDRVPSNRGNAYKWLGGV